MIHISLIGFFFKVKYSFEKMHLSFLFCKKK